MNNSPGTTNPGADAQVRIARRLRRRYRAEFRFRLYGIMAVSGAMLFLVMLLAGIIGNGYSAFQQTYLTIDIYFDPARVDPDGDRSRASLEKGDYASLVKISMRELFPQVTSRKQRREMYKLASRGATYTVRDMLLSEPELLGKVVSVKVAADDDVDMLLKGHIDRAVPEEERRISNMELEWIDHLIASQRIEKSFNRTFFTAGDSREPELAGIRGAITGSLLTLLVTLALSFPVGVAAAVYLEEFAPRTRITDLIEVNINNLAAVPSIVFGLLGLAVFISFFGLPRSAPLVGGIVLSLMTLPTIIIAGRAALKSVPPTIRDAALAMGASRMQMVLHHVVPLAMPGMLTGTIIGMAQALGESAPLLMIGMVAFIVDVPGGITDPATVLPVQIYLWADSPERAFMERTSAAIMVLLGFLVVMNALAVYLRKRFEIKW